VISIIMALQPVIEEGSEPGRLLEETLNPDRLLKLSISLGNAPIS